MHYRNPDHPPICEFLGYWEETINRWYLEGLPTNIVMSTCGVSSYKGSGVSGGRSVSGIPSICEYFGLETKVRLRLDFGPIPRFVVKKVEDAERYRVEKDESGALRKVMKKGTTIPGFIEFPVKNRIDFEKIQERFNPSDPRRYPLDWEDEGTIEHYDGLESPIGLVFPGFFGQGRTWMGLKNFVLLFFKDPDLVHDMFRFWTDFLLQTMKDAVGSIRIDYAGFWEDMAFRDGPLISPTQFREFMLPYYKEVVAFLRENGIDVITVDSDGDNDLLIPLFMEAGVNCPYPSEVQANMDVVQLRKKYGRDLLLIGGIDKRVLARGPRAIEKELEYKLPPLMEGGFIPSVDHLVPPDVSLKNYEYYVELLKKHLLE
jgi:uroporphyrinogen decarboxylase